MDEIIFIQSITILAYEISALQALLLYGRCSRPRARASHEAKAGLFSIIGPSGPQAL
jgi:hypothetical protein